MAIRSQLYPNTGIYEAELEEDFIQTVIDLKKPFLKARIKALYEFAEEYPFTLVPSSFFIFPLRKGDIVYVQLTDDDARFPVLYDVDITFPSELTSSTTPPFPTPGSDVTFPSVADTVKFDYWGGSCYTLYTDSYAVLRYEDSVFLISPDRIMLFSQGDIMEKGTSLIQEFAGSYSIKSNSLYLKDLISDLMDSLIGMTTVGSAALHVPSPDTLAKWAQLKLQFGAFFGA